MRWNHFFSRATFFPMLVISVSSMILTVMIASFVMLGEFKSLQLVMFIFILAIFCSAVLDLMKVARRRNYRSFSRRR